MIIGKYKIIILGVIIFTSLTSAQTATNTLIYINTDTQTIIAYDPTTNTHISLFTCPTACYDPMVDDSGRIGMVTPNGFAIYDPVADEYTPFNADFGVYGYKGNAVFRGDLAVVVYDARFDMNSRLMLMDLASGEITDLHGAGVGKPSWSADGEAVLLSTGTSLITIPINGDEPRTDIIYTPTITMPSQPSAVYTTMFTDLVTPFGDDLLYRGSNELGYWLFLHRAGATIEIASAPVIMGYTTSAGMIAYITYDPRAGVYEIEVVAIDSNPLGAVGTTYMPSTHIKAISPPPSPLPISWRGGTKPVLYGYISPTRTRYIASLQSMDITGIQTTEILHVALSPDGRYVAWMAENPDLGFGFYDIWLVDISHEEKIPIRIAEAISNPSVRPSGIVWQG